MIHLQRKLQIKVVEHKTQFRTSFIIIIITIDYFKKN
jgi:PleD family two-component response regulator